MNLGESNITKDNWHVKTESHASEAESINLKYKWIFLTAIIVITLIVYSSIFKNNFINWDDDAFVYNNPDIQNLKLENIKAFFTKNYVNDYLPFTMISFAVDYKIGGLNPKIYIFTNLFLHILNSLLVFGFILLLIRSIEKAKYDTHRQYIKPYFLSAITAVLFAIHPINVESVAWISERKNVLYVFFFLLSLIFYIKYLEKEKFKFYGITLLLFLCSLLSKGVAVSLPLCIVSIDYLFKRKLISKNVIIEKIPFFLLSFIFGIIAIIGQGKDIVRINEFTFNQLAFASYSFVNYIFKIILPVNLSAYYFYPRGASLIHWSYFVLLLVFLVMLFIYRKQVNLSRFPFFAICFYVVNIVFMIQLIPYGNMIMADRYIYLSSIGFFLLIAILIVQLNYKIVMLFILSGVFLVLSGFATHERIKVWKDSITFWDNLIEQNNSFPPFLNNRGNARKSIGDNQGAIIDYSNAIQLKPDYYDALYNKVVVEFEQSNYKDALVDINKVVFIKPDYTKAYTIRGKINYALGKMDEALNDFSKALSINPADAEIYCFMGNIKREIGDYKDAFNYYSIAIQKMPEFKEAYNFRGITNYYLREPQQALNDFDIAIQKDPYYAEAFYNRGKLNFILKEFNKALPDLNQAIKLNPSYLNAYLIRAKVKLNMTDYAGAINDCDEIKKLNKNDHNAYIIEAFANYKSGNFEKAINLVNYVISQKPNAGILYYLRGMSNIKSGNINAGNADINTAKKLGFNASENELTANVSGH